MICAPNSGSGKTLITCALLRILMRRGFVPASFKCGPDYIDPMFHRTVLGIPSRNLDLFLQGKSGVQNALEKGMQGRDFGVIEAVMGFFDGLAAGSLEGSSYEIACVTDTPAVLVVNCRGMSTSIVPLVKGFCEYGDRKLMKGIILNNISPMVAKDISKKIYTETKVPVIGCLPVIKEAYLESRHLGLVLPDEIPGALAAIDTVADELEAGLDLDRLLEIADVSHSDIAHTGSEEAAVSQKEETGAGDLVFGTLNREQKVRIGIARDEAFCFYYEDNLELLKEM